MDRGTIVIRHNKRGVKFDVFDPGKREEAKIFAGALHAGGEDPFVCCNLQELTELREVVDSVIAWNKKYPTNKIFNESEIREIAKEMDTINAAAIAATLPSPDEKPRED